MADDEVTPLGSPTTNYGWIKPTVGADDDAWGGLLNTDLDGIDSTVKSVSNAIPAASLTTPVMSGAGAVGTGMTWARADHQHPSDTSRYAASNPSGYQTAAQVTTSLASYLPLAGGTLSGALTPSQTAGLVGTTAANNANAGSIGEHVTASQLTNVSMTSGVAVNIVSISLTRGDWDVEGNVQIIPSAGASAAGAVVSNASGAYPAIAGSSQLNLNSAAITAFVGPTGSQRFSLASTTTVYLAAIAVFASGTCAGQGVIWARRRR